MGGGCAAASLAFQFARHSPVALAVTIVEPRRDAGRGLAYSATDPDHRLNGTPTTHSIDPADPLHFERWCAARGLALSDPDGVSPDGLFYPRRSDFGDYLAQTVRGLGTPAANGVRVEHRRALALALREAGGALEVDVRDEPGGGACATLQAGLVVVATGNPPPRVPRPFDGALAAHPGMLADPWDTGRVHAIDPDARVLVIGTGLTAVDILSTLVRRAHRGAILAVSRRGLMPREQRPLQTLPGPATGNYIMERIDGPVPEFIRALGPSPSARALLRATRAAIAAALERGEVWQVPFDDLRDVVWKIWPTLAAPQKRRFLARLRTWYDVHRFRMPPGNGRMVAAAIASGRVELRAARIVAARADGPLRVRLQPPRADAFEREFDVVVNCTGLDAASGMRANPFLEAANAAGLVVPDDSGVGFAVDAACRAIGAEGTAHPRLFMIGPPTAGVFGDPTGAVFIAAQVRRTLPAMFAALGAA